MKSALFNEAVSALVKACEELEEATKLHIQAKKDMTLLNATELKNMRLTSADIAQIDPVYPQGRSTKKYQAADVQRYIDSRKVKSKKSK